MGIFFFSTLMVKITLIVFFSHHTFPYSKNKSYFGHNFINKLLGKVR